MYFTAKNAAKRDGARKTAAKRGGAKKAAKRGGARKTTAKRGGAKNATKRRAAKKGGARKAAEAAVEAISGGVDAIKSGMGKMMG